MVFSSWLRHWKRPAPAPRRGTPTSPRPRARFRPRLESLEDRTVPSGFQQINLVGYQPGMAHFTDSNLNGWGMTSLPDGSFCVANAFSTGLATFYDRSGHVLPQTITVPVEAQESAFLSAALNVDISPVHGHPTGVVYNSTSDFVITNPATGVSAPATLIFDTIDGTLSGWNPLVDATHAILIRDTWAAGAPAIYTGLEIGQDSHGNNVLYAADFLNNQLEVIGGDFQDIGKPISCAGLGVASDPYSWVWSVQAVNDELYVTFADLLNPAGGGGGAVDVFNSDGSFQYQLDANGPGSQGRLQNPWGITQAPANFGAYSNDLLVGNVAGAGNINAYDPNTHQWLGQLRQPNGTPIAIKGLWDLEFGDGTPDSGKTNQLFFDAGPNHPGDSTGGLFGVIRAAGDQGGNGGGGPVGAIMSASTKSSSQGHGGGSGGSGGNFYPTASTVSQLIADINYADKVGGAVTINLQPGTTFDLNQINNTSYSYYNANALPIVGSTKAVNLTILGNGDTVQWTGGSTYSNVQVRLLEIAQLGSLTLDDVKLQNGSAQAGGAIYNEGTLKVIDHSTLSGNSASEGGAIYNAGGTVTVSNSTLSGNTAPVAPIGYPNPDFGGAIFNAGGTVAISDSILSGNFAGAGGAIYNDSTGTLTVSGCTVSGNTASQGGGIYNAGTVTVENSSSITGNTAPAGYGADLYNLGVLYLDSSSTIGVLDGNPAILI